MDKYSTNFQIKNKTFCFILFSVVTFNFITLNSSTLNVVYNYCSNIENYIFTFSLRLRIDRNKLILFRLTCLSFNLRYNTIVTILLDKFSLLVKKKYGSQTLKVSLCERVKLNHTNYFLIYIYLF